MSSDRQLQRELAGVLLHLRGLVLVRELLARRGASPAEIEEHSAEIERIRDRLARLVMETGDEVYGAAA
jgi:hypothetical protein